MRWTVDGRLEFLGRTDRQVKVRGFRIELREIENVLVHHPAVRQCAVVVRTDDAAGARHSRPTSSRLPAPRRHAQLRRHVADELPEHMVPATTALLDALPVTANGSKIDVAALPAPVPTAASVVAPVTGPAGVLAALFGDVLGVPAVGADDSFFELGGDSILSIQLVGRARAAGLTLSPKQVFELRTPARLAAASSLVAAAVADRPEDALGDCPATPVMEWLRAQGGPVDSFHQSLLVHTPVGVTGPWLLGAVETLTRRHEALRASLVRGDDRWSLHVPERGEAVADIVTVVEAAELSTVELDDAVETHARDAAAALDPERGRMCRFVWFDCGPRRGRLLMVVHHLVVDGVSWRILTEDLAILHADPAAPLAGGTSWRQWSLALRAEAATESRAAELDHWLDVTRPAAPVGIRPLDPARDIVATMRQVGATVSARRPGRC